MTEYEQAMLIMAKTQIELLARIARDKPHHYDVQVDGIVEAMDRAVSQLPTVMTALRGRP
jgi:hypothetical protein